MDGTRKVSRLSASTRSRLPASSGESPWDLSPLGLGVNLICIMRSSYRAALTPKMFHVEHERLDPWNVFP